jgi:hypothetical protein
MFRDTRETRNLLYPLGPSNTYGSELLSSKTPCSSTEQQMINVKASSTLSLRCSESGAQEFRRFRGKKRT